MCSTETALVKSCKEAPKNILHWHDAFWSVRSINWNSQLEQSNSKPAIISVFQKHWGDTCTGNSASYAQRNFIKSLSYFPSLSPNSHLLVEQLWCGRNGTFVQSLSVTLSAALHSHACQLVDTDDSNDNYPIIVQRTD